MTEAMEDMGPLRSVTIGDLYGRKCNLDESIEETGRQERNRLKMRQQRAGWEDEMGKSQLVGG